MARASQTTQVVSRVGTPLVMTTPVGTGAGNGDIVDCGRNVWVEVLNGSGAPINVTVKGTYAQDGVTVADLVVAVAAGARSQIGPLFARTFGQLAGADAGRAYVEYSAVTTVTRAVAQLSTT